MATGRETEDHRPLGAQLVRGFDAHGAKVAVCPTKPEDRVRKPLILLSSIALLLTLAAPASAVQPNGRGNDEHAGKSDNLPGRLAQKQLKLKKAALDKVLKGEAKPKGPNKVVEVAKGQYVELALDGTDQILTLLG
jgi:immune inhibitor A